MFIHLSTEDTNISHLLRFRTSKTDSISPRCYICTMILLKCGRFYLQSQATQPARALSQIHILLIHSFTTFNHWMWKPAPHCYQTFKVENSFSWFLIKKDNVNYIRNYWLIHSLFNSEPVMTLFIANKVTTMESYNNLQHYRQLVTFFDGPDSKPVPIDKNFDSCRL